jgi:hypothetical protein
MGTFRPQTLVWMNHNDLTMSLEWCKKDCGESSPLVIQVCKLL